MFACVCPMNLCCFVYMYEQCLKLFTCLNGTREVVNLPGHHLWIQFLNWIELNYELKVHWNRIRMCIIQADKCPMKVKHNWVLLHVPSNWKLLTNLFGWFLKTYVYYYIRQTRTLVILTLNTCINIHILTTLFASLEWSYRNAIQHNFVAIEKDSNETQNKYSYIDNVYLSL